MKLFFNSLRNNVKIQFGSDLETSSFHYESAVKSQLQKSEDFSLTFYGSAIKTLPEIAANF
jgi:hypothetical protein